MQLLIVPGNNDLEGDYLMPPPNSSWIQFLLTLWAPALPSNPEAIRVGPTISCRDTRVLHACCMWYHPHLL